MTIFRLIELSAVALIVVLFLTQIIVPVIRNRPFFPMFSKEGRLRKALAEAQQQRDEKRLAKAIKKAKE